MIHRALNTPADGMDNASEEAEPAPIRLPAALLEAVHMSGDNTAGSGSDSGSDVDTEAVAMEQLQFLLDDTKRRAVCDAKSWLFRGEHASHTRLFTGGRHSVAG